MKKLIVVAVTAGALALTGCGAANTPQSLNDQYCDGNIYTAVDEDDYTCSENGNVYYHGDHEDDKKKKKTYTKKPTTTYGKPAPVQSKKPGFFAKTKAKVKSFSSSRKSSSRRK